MTQYWILNHWRVALLGLTGIALSIASGWTTWDGMANFTREPLLSLLITFGIQSVMLVTAWLIGETFANRLRSRTARRASAPSGLVIAAITVFGAALATALAIIILGGTATLSNLMLWASDMWPQARFGVGLATLIAMTIAAAVVALSFRAIAADLAGILRVVFDHILLWVMFVACMAASVFFSFDSLFNVVFPETERARAAVVRSQSGSDAIANRIRSTTERERLAERVRVLASPEWTDYAAKLDAVAAALTAAAESAAASQRAEAATQERAASGRARQLAQLTVESQLAVRRREGATAALQERRDDLARLQAAQDTRGRKISELRASMAAKASEARAEELGLGPSAQQGRGSRYRALARELSILGVELQLLEKQDRLATQSADAATAAVGAAETALSAAAGEVARITARIDALKPGQASDTAEAGSIPSVSAISEHVQRLANDRSAFARAPSRASLDAVQASCQSALSGRGAGTTGTVTPDHCNAARLHAASARLYALQAGTLALSQACAPSGSTVEASAALAQARTCLQVSGLSEPQALQLRRDIDSLERNRDDKAHRFIVTWNAFDDGNRLAVLALILALGIDGLVFIAGLLGATAARSHFSTLPRIAGQSVRWAEATVRNALQPAAGAIARLALAHIAPAPTSVAADALSPAGPVDEWTHELTLRGLPRSTREALRRLVNAATVIGAARCRDGDDATYLLRVELVEFLTSIPPDDTSADTMLDAPADYGLVLSNALQSDPVQQARRIIGHLSPSDERTGFTGELDPAKFSAADTALLRRFLNAIAIEGGVRRSGDGSVATRFLVHRDACAALEQILIEAPPVIPAPAINPSRNVAALATPRADKSRVAQPTAPTRTFSITPRPGPTAPSSAAPRAVPKERTPVPANTPPAVVPAATETSSQPPTTPRPKVTIDGDTLRFDR